jgi:hypothetical protein
MLVSCDIKAAAKLIIVILRIRLAQSDCVFILKIKVSDREKISNLVPSQIWLG